MSGSKTTTSKTKPPKWAEPYYKGYLSSAQSLASKPYQAYTGERNAGFTQDQLNAMQMTRDQVGINQGAWSQGLGQLQGFANGSMKNPYSGQNNPYLEQMIQNSNAGISRNYMDSIQPNLMNQFSASGAFGGSAHEQMLLKSQQALADSLAQNETGMRGQEYDIQRQLAEQDLARQGQAISALPAYLQGGYQGASALSNIGNAQQQLQQNIYNTGYSDYLDQRNYPAKQLGLLGDALQVTSGAYQNRQDPNQNYQSPWQTAAGIATAFGGFG
jgi:hypothetical protein